MQAARWEEEQGEVVGGGVSRHDTMGENGKNGRRKKKKGGKKVGGKQ